MRFEKLPTTIDQQILLLRERGLIVEPEATAQLWLETVGYYRLSAYWLPFEEVPIDGQTRSKRFISGTEFSVIMDLYVFDRKLRLLVTEAIERIETSVRARWTNRLSLEKGSHAHMNALLQSCAWTHAGRVARLAERVRESREVFVEHYKGKYTDPLMPPLWVVTELMTFGELSKWVEATGDARLRQAVARDIGLPTQEALVGTLQLLSYVRNICAHHSRLWNRRTVKRLPNIKRFKDSLAWDSGATEDQRQLDNRVYNTLTVLALLMRYQAPDTSFVQRMIELVETRDANQLQGSCQGNFACAGAGG